MVGTDAGTYVEIQGTAEGKPFDRGQMDRLLSLADGGLQKLFAIQDEVLGGQVTSRSLAQSPAEHPRAADGGSSSPPVPATRSTSWPSCSTCPRWSC